MARKISPASEKDYYPNGTSKAQVLCKPKEGFGKLDKRGNYVVISDETPTSLGEGKDPSRTLMVNPKKNTIAASPLRYHRLVSKVDLSVDATVKCGT